MSSETDNLSYTGLCLWDSCLDCPHMYECDDSTFLEEECIWDSCLDCPQMYECDYSTFLEEDEETDD